MAEDARGRLTALREDVDGRLVARKAALDALVRDRSGSSDDDEHDPEGVPLSAEWSRLSGLVEDAQSELTRIDEALARVGAGAYGICIDCGEPIPDGRLEALPFAELCVPCAERRGR